MHRVRMSLLGVVGKDDDAIAVIEASDSRVTRLAGEAMAAVPSASAIDAIVMASAALRGDCVYQ